MSVQDYFDKLPDDRKAPIAALWKAIGDNIPAGFEPQLCYNMPSYVVPHSLYPPGYHCDPKLPLAFISIASQKNFIAVHHMGMYADANLVGWFTAEYTKHSKYKLDMGKACIRFKKMDQIPFELICQLAAKVTPQQYVAMYEKILKR
ncbi:DUF1801 domain-containing protein [Mucilaginibacter sp.]|uniref:DUF1801 domain-containing protein n=1 Tax=Mucilaginibacter sp. TaxID=1882438 RepID=UPI002622367D|nr:DUF1801 domain-containing protein [Mucilaginibacter sp.]MDB4926350.1 hypothetical protein [Mucilaginibacter sp.]